MLNFKLKRISSVLLTSVMLLSTATVFANESNAIESSNDLEIDINSLDLNDSYYARKEFVNDDGITVIIENTFTPNPNYDPNAIYNPMLKSNNNPASVGTWNASSQWGMYGIQYDFDLTKSGSEWTISNGRNLNASGVFVTVSNQNLSIARATSTPSFAAEINGSADMKLFDNQWIQFGTAHPISTTRVINDIVTTSNN